MTERPANPTAEVEPLVDPLHLGEVRAIMGALTKFIHGKKIYAKNNPNLIKFAKEFDAALQVFFRHEEELVLGIEKHEIKWCGETVYDNEKREESIAFLLYKDGVGEISLQRSVTFNELERLVDLIKNEIHNNRPEEDIVTKLWKADFDHISYRVLDEYLVGQFGEGKPAEGEQSPLEIEDHPDLPSFSDKGRVIVEAKDTKLESITSYLNSIADRSVPNGTAEEKEMSFQTLAESLFRVSREELRLYHEELSAERDSDDLVEFFKVIIDFTLLADNPSVVRDTTNVLECIVDYLATDKDPRQLAEVLRAVREFVIRQQTTEHAHAFFQEVEERLTNPEFLRSLGVEMKNGEIDPDVVFGYFGIVGEAAIPVICGLLETLEGSRVHRMACDVLVAIAGDNIADAMKQLRIDVPVVAQDAVYLIDKSGATPPPELVQELIYYPNNRVREIIISYLVRSKTDDAALSLVKLLDDTDKRIRIKVLAAIEDNQFPVMTDKLIDMAFDKRLSKRAFEEQELIFKALGRTAGEDVLPRLVDLATKTPRLMFNKQAIKQRKLLAICALEGIRTIASADVLETLARDSNDLVRSRACRVLDEFDPVEARRPTDE
jgi:hypothetical protein